MTPPERSPERDAAIEALLPWVGVDGWTMEALCRAAGRDADLLFPGGPADLVEAYSDLADRWMEADAALLTETRLSRRLRGVIAARLQRNAPYKDAVRRGLSLLALPGHAGVALRCTARTVDSMWHAAGERSVDFSWYTRRATLAAVWGAVLLVWLRDDSPDGAATLAFLDRRLAGVARVGRLRARLGARCRRPAAAGAAAATINS